MGTLTPAQIGLAQADEPEATTSAEEQPAPFTPIFQGSDTALWIGVGGAILVMLTLLLLIIRSRVISPASQQKDDGSGVFEPAGADAEITFDDQPTNGFAEPAPVKEIEAPEAESISSPSENSSRHAPFAGLFNRNNDQATRNEEATIEDSAQEVRIDHLPEIDEDYLKAEREREEMLARAEADQLAKEVAERERLREEEEQRNAEEARIAEWRAGLEREAHEREAKQNAAVAELETQFTETAERVTAQAQETHAELSSALEGKFDSLREDLANRFDDATTELEQMKANAGAAAASAAAAAAAASAANESNTDISAITDAIAEMTQSTNAKFAALSSRIDALIDAQPSGLIEPAEIKRLNDLLAERAAPAVAGALQLNDLIRTALPVDRYRFDYALLSGAQADCLVTRADAAPFAIDARYPVEAFDHYARAVSDQDKIAASNAYRRAVLRHLIFVAEKLIVDEETADFAVLFTPNDIVFNDLHQNFADVVQDSYRARIWIASPTSLMAMLHLMNVATAPDPEPMSGGYGIVRGELTTLAERVDALEARLEAVNEMAPEPISEPQQTPVYEAPQEEVEFIESDHPTTTPPDYAVLTEPVEFDEAFDSDEAEVQIIIESNDGRDLDGNAPEEPSDAPPPRPPFPLR